MYGHQELVETPGVTYAGTERKPVQEWYTVVTPSLPFSRCLKVHQVRGIRGPLAKAIIVKMSNSLPRTWSWRLSRTWV